MPIEGLAKSIQNILNDIQNNLLENAKNFRKENTTYSDNFDDFKDILNQKGGFIEAHWDGTAETENEIKLKTKATIRCIPNNQDKSPGKCVYSGKPSKGKVIFAKAY